MRIIGIDPGYDRVGWAVAEVNGRQLEVLGSGLLHPATAELYQRYQQILTELNALIRQFEPQQAVMEEIYFSTNQKTAMTVSEARGLILGCLIAAQIQPFSISPTTVKSRVTGDGRANKAAVQRMISLQLKLKLDGKVDDEIDAIGILYAFVLGQNPNFSRSRSML